MKPGFADLFKAAQQTVALCEVKPEENVVVYCDTRQNPALVEAFHTACVAAGADVSLLRTLHRFPETDPPPAAIAAMKAADMVFDLATESWFYAPCTPEILDTGARMLLFVDVLEENIVARPPDAEVAARAARAAMLLQQGQEFRVTTPEGTDFVCRRGERRAKYQQGFVNRPGTHDLYANTTIAFAPPETEAEGVLYLNGPQILYPQYTYVVQQPVRVEVVDGRIVDIDDSHEDGRIFKQWIEQFDDEHVYTIAHFGFSLDHRARDISRFDLSVWESLYGGVLVAFGANDSKSLGGKTRAKGHSDSMLLRASFFVDGHPLILDGEFTSESGLRPNTHV
jgi:leucyl aminopeptidase (aminopeptidase T)